MTMGDERDDGILDLGVVGRAGGEGPPEPAGRSAHPWRHWAVPAAALLVGGLLGAVVADARHDAAELARVGVVSAVTNWTPERSDAGTSVEVQLMNIGARAVEIVGLEADGFAIDPGAGSPDAILAPVGEWVTVRQDGLVADCAAAAPTHVRVRIRDDGGDERTVTADQQADYGGLDMLWSSECEFGAGYVQFAGPVTARSDGASLTVTLPMLNHSGRPARVTSMVPMVPGMSAVPPELPIELDGNSTVQVAVTWTVEDCAEATTMSGYDGQIEYSVTSGTTQLPERFPLDAPTMVELVRLAGHVCG
ncbi:hypothetical protein E1262_26910 [Jiangella aurantiaca]|uniref:Uncharacterized protein n=1 Tax=Jiangella aurantiaca TaxID=2530373 RepID=A0A4R5A0H7_9ACTN|nr:hypothetical protein [Jiangella aurantiaca]TDD64895.1 hypothetical protein E1262_26910 [Jiangella aurantiaca]